VVEVLVVGAGPTGLTLACELWRHGLPCRIIDRRGVPVDRTRAVDVQARTLEVFQRLGVVDSIIGAGRRLGAMSIYDGPACLARLEYKAHGAEYPFGVAIPQTQTESILEQRLEELGGVVERGCRLKSLVGAKHHVDVTLSLADGTTEETQAAWVVGCDGVASSVRDEANIEFDNKGAMRSFTTCDATLDWHLPDSEVSLFISDSGFLLVLPLPGENRARLITDGAPTKGSFGDAESMAKMAAIHVGANLNLRDTGFVGTYYVQRRLARTFRQGRVLLAGDAAHTFDPVGGHGMNQGIQSAFNLGWKLALVANQGCDEALLDTYDTERRTAAKRFTRELDFAATLQLSELKTDEDTHDRLMDFAAGGAPLRRSVLDAALQPQSVYKSQFVREHVASGYESKAGAVAGCAAPNVHFGTTDNDRLYRRLDGRQHTLLLFAGANGDTGLPLTRSVIEVAKGVMSRWSRRVAVCLAIGRGTEPRDWDGPLIIDERGELHARYGATLPCAYLVRPDDHIAYRSCPMDADGLQSFLIGLFRN